MFSKIAKPQNDILSLIIANREKDSAELGLTFGCNLPDHRKWPIVPFLSEKGSILEIKRGSPSKGDIEPELDAKETAVMYARAGAEAISVLTERNYFKGNLTDLIETSNAINEYCLSHGHKNHIALLRKDFLLSAEEIDVSYRAGADAVLLIARILSTKKLLTMVNRCKKLGITAFIELRYKKDIEKLTSVVTTIKDPPVVCGVNARNLSDFSIDPLIPAGMLNLIHTKFPEIKIVFESGIQTPQEAAFAASLGFYGILVGEAAAKNPLHSDILVKAFLENPYTSESQIWKHIGSRIINYSETFFNSKKEENKSNYCGRPLIKICGLTNIQDSLESARLGADFLGFIFSKKTQRQANASLVHHVYSALTFHESSISRKPILVGVVTDPDSEETKEALKLVREGVLDMIQFHNCYMPPPREYSMREIPRFSAIEISTTADVTKMKTLLHQGQPRILIDTTKKSEKKQCIKEYLIKEISKSTKLWIAGGITPENIQTIIQNYHPELIDIASGIEISPGIKDHKKMHDLFNNINREVLND